MTAFELVIDGEPPTSPTARIENWAARGSTFTTPTLDPWLSAFGPVTDIQIDLCRVAVAANLADRKVVRPLTWSRNIELIVHVTDVAAIAAAVDLVEIVLFWLTGDDWRIDLVQSTSLRPPATPSTPVHHQQVALLSGGLDSACGASLLGTEVAYLGHFDNPAVGKSQKDIATALTAVLGSPLTYKRVSLRPTGKTKEPTTRTRSLLFMVLATALASAVGATEILIPENGFTSLNPPLALNRGGPNTTRSTHPTTFAYLNEILGSLSLDITMSNPHSGETKGQLVAKAADVHGVGAITALASHSLSCAKLNGNFYKGGNPNLGCGACVACMTRRGSLLTGLGHDPTSYLRQQLFQQRNNGPEAMLALQQFESDHSADIDAVKAHRGWAPTLPDLIALGPYPHGFDLDQALSLIDTGMKELVDGLP